MTNTLKPCVLPTIRQLKTHSLTSVVQHEIEQMILSGELSAGKQLNENALAKKLSVSRGPIREACRALAELGFVHLIPNRGFFVTRLDKTDALEVYDLRAGLKGLAGALLAPMVTEQHIEHLQRLINQMDRAVEAADHSAFNPLNLEFHDAIVEATGNSRLIKMYRGLVKEAHLFRTHGLVSQAAMVASNKEHRAIIEALKRRNSRECYDASFQHVANGKQRMLAALAKIENEDSPDQTEEVMAGGGRNASALK